MTGLLAPGLLVQATAIALEHEPVPTDQITAGTPTTGFVVLAGRATLVARGADPVELVPGSVVQLVAGMVTSWTVHETLRKIYVV